MLLHIITLSNNLVVELNSRYDTFLLETDKNFDKRGIVKLSEIWEKNIN